MRGSVVGLLFFVLLPPSQRSPKTTTAGSSLRPSGVLPVRLTSVKEDATVDEFRARVLAPWRKGLRA